MKKKCNCIKGLLCGIIFLSLVSGQSIFAQQVNVTGKVTMDQTNEPLAGVTVLEKGTMNGKITNIDGNFSITVTTSNSILVFSFIGMKSQEVVVGGQGTINVALKEDVGLLDEVVVTGYQVQRKVDLTGSVSVVKMGDLKDNPSGSPLRSIQGKISGVYITSDGSPSGGLSNIYIRGINTLGSTSPLYIIDGIPTTSSSVFQNMDPNSISSVQVLKDASAASIYGSRASNGVIIVTTKEGNEKTSVRLTSSFTTQNYVRRLDMANTEQLGRALWQASINDRTNPTAHNALYSFEWETNADGVAILNKVIPVEWIGGNESFGLKSADTNWQDEVFRTGLISSNSLSINSGTELSSLLVDLTHYSNKGIVINNDYNRISGRVNSSTKFFNGKIKIGENLQISSTSETPVPSDLGGASVINLATTIMPILPVYKTDGTYSGPYGSGFSDRSNPLHISSINEDDRNNNLQLFGNLFFEATPIKNLIFRSSFGMDYNSAQNKNIERAFSTGFLSRTINSLAISQSTNFNWTWSNTMNYLLKYNDNSVTFLLGIEAIKQSSNSFSARREGFALEDVEYYYLDAGTGTSTNGGTGSGSQLLSYFGKINYSLKEKYLASGTLRYDGSSRFGLENTFGLFPSASVGWVLSKEAFISDKLPFVSLFKLRAGLGRVGNQEIGNNARFGLYTTNYTSTAYDLSGAGTGTLPSGFVASQTANSKLKWETTNETNFGADFGFLEQKITASIDYFVRETKDILIRPSYPGVIAEGGSQYVNGATLNNKGYEFELGYNGTVGKLDFNVTGSISHFADEITYLPASVVKSYAGNVEKTILGHSRTSYFGYVTDGLFQTQEDVDSHATQAGKGVGRIRYKDLNGDGKIDPLDQDWLGTSIPDFEYGINVSLSYKGLNLSMFMHGVQGITVNDGSKSTTDFMGTILGVNKGTALLNAWTPQNTSSTIPMLSLTNANNETRTSDYFLVNGSYLKMSSMQLSYNLPQGIIQVVKLSEARIYVLGENFMLIKDTNGKNAFTGQDPETPGTTYPQPVRLTFGLDVKF